MSGLASSTSAGAGAGRTFTITHKQDESSSNDYLKDLPVSTNSVPTAALRQAAAQGSASSTKQGARCPLGFGHDSATTSATGSGGKCPMGFGGSELPRVAESGGGGKCPLGFEGSGPPGVVASEGGGGGGGKCPLGFGGGGSGETARRDLELPAMTLAVLARHDGKIPGMPAFVSVRGIILNVTKDEAGLFKEGGMFGGCAGHDVSRLLAVRGEPGALDCGLSGLTFDDQVLVCGGVGLQRGGAWACARRARLPDAGGV